MRLFRQAAVLMLAGWCSQSMAQGVEAYPSKPISLVIPFAAGGPTDFEARLYTQKMSESMGKPIVFDYRVGAGGAIGTTYAAKAAPDGYTLVPGQGSFTVAAATVKNLGYDPVKDFAPIALMSKRSMLLVATPGHPVKNVGEYVNFVKQKPGELNFAMLGPGSVFHLAGAWLNGIVGGQVTYVPYTGVAPSTVDMLAGRAHVTFMTPEVGLPLVKSGKVRLLATTGAERHPLLQDAPTLMESGVRGYAYYGWYGFFAPAGTPPQIIARLNAELVKAGKSPDVAKKMADAGGSIMVLSTPAQLGEHVVSELTRWKKVVQDNRIMVD